MLQYAGTEDAMISRFKMFELVLTGVLLAAGEPSEDFEYISLTVYDDTIQTAHRAYRAGEFDRAFNNYWQCARWGEKECQQILGALYLAGQGTEVNIVEGYAWLKLAAESGNRNMKDTLKQAEKALPEAAVEAGDEVYEEYLALYGIEAMGISCKRRRSGDSAKRVVVCERPRDLRTTNFKLPRYAMVQPESGGNQ